jgi:FkbM family methyltransferase
VKRLLDLLHQFLARWRFTVFVALKVRNQCAAVIGYRQAASPHHERNGEDWLIQRIGRDVRTFVDVGARHGQWTALVLRHASPGVRGLLFEPDDGCLPVLRTKFGRNESLELCPRALGEERGELPFRIDGERSRVVVVGQEADAARRVVVSTIDDELAERRWTAVDVVKIDAEGYDFHVIRGAAAMLAAQGVGFLQFEYGDQWPYACSTLAGAVGFLAAHGYETYLLRPEALEPVRYELWGEHFSYSNYVAVAPAWRARVQSWIRR